MRPPDRSSGESRSAQHDGAPVRSDDAAWTAVERLVVSREHLRVALLERTEPARSASGTAGSGSTRWLDGLATLPGMPVVIDALRGWWMAHPWRVAATLALGAAHAVVKPVAQRHPVGLVVAALLFGGLVVWTRPWRWAFRAGLLGGLGPHLFTRTLAGLPLQSWLAAWARAPARSPSGAVPPA